MNILQIGVTGHRILDEIVKLQAGIDQALIRIAEAYPGEVWSVVSSLAEGADRLVVQRVLLARPEARLIVPLPLPVIDYRLDFSTEQSPLEFESLLVRADEVILPPKGTFRSDCYWLAGKTVLERSDVLIALWDGLNAQGPGGTGEMVKAARMSGLPLAWVHCGNRTPGINQATNLGEEQGKVSFERFRTLTTPQ